MSPLDFISQNWSIFATIVGGAVTIALLRNDVKNLKSVKAEVQKEIEKKTKEIKEEIGKHQIEDNKQHEETSRRVDRIEEANMNNAQSNAVLGEQISNLKERLISLENTFKEEMRLFRDSLQGLFREKK